MKKYQKIKPEKSFRPQARHPGPRFPAGLCALDVGKTLSASLRPLRSFDYRIATKKGSIKALDTFN
ncbi:MAG: hypothetical protein V4553_22330 [Bacteroidota bacterium]